MRASLRTFVWTSIAGLILAAMLAGDASLTFVRSVYGSRYVYEDSYRSVIADDLLPTTGLTWYFFVEMFTHFRPFFLAVVNIHMWTYMIPITMKYRSDPLFATTFLAGIASLFSMYPSVGDTAAYLALWSLLYPRLSDCTYTSTHHRRPSIPHGDKLAVRLHDTAFPCFPLSMALCGLSECQLLLCHRPGPWLGYREFASGQCMGLGP